MIVSHKRRFRYLRQWLFNITEDIHSDDGASKYFIPSAQAIALPLASLANELDQRVLAELHRTIDLVDETLSALQIESATQQLISFIEKLTNWYLRRSRRRFRTETMTEDKQQAYATLFTVIRTYLQLCAPFIPFVTEQLWQDMSEFTLQKSTHPSVHLQNRPLTSSLYVNQQLINEIETVRKVIKGALYLRAKQQVKVKQPLSQLQFRV